MNYPTISEYVESIMSAEDNFDQLSSLRPVLDSNGNPVMSSGNFAVVFKMKDLNTGKLRAVKCFIKDQEERNERYAMIAAELEQVKSPYILPIRFLENELFVDTSQSDETEFPVLVMDWVEGKTLDAYLRENLNNQYQLQMLSCHFCQMSVWLISQRFAHGDLKPDNILVQDDGSLVLVDYDGFYVPAMEGMEALELGSPDFRHPLRTSKDFNEHLDDFSIATIALSLKAISLDSKLYHTFAASDRLLLSTTDYRDISNSVAMQKIKQVAYNSDISMLIGAFYVALAKKTLYEGLFSALKLNATKKTIIIEAKGSVLTNEDVIYTNEKYGKLEYVVVPKNVTKIDCAAFEWFSSLIEIIIPDSVIEIGGCAFYECASLTKIILPKSLKKIGYGAFDRCSKLKYIEIPNSVLAIEGGAFYACEELKEISLPSTLSKIEHSTFTSCRSLRKIKIPNSVIEIGDYAFFECKNLDEIYIPNSVIKIGRDVFSHCFNLTKVCIPKSVMEIGSDVFLECSKLRAIVIPKGTRQRFENMLEDDLHSKLVEEPEIESPPIVLGEGNDLITKEDVKQAKEKYGELINVIIADSVSKIDSCAFCHCCSLMSIIIPNTVTEIASGAFYGCDNLTSIIIPKSVNKIGQDAFMHTGWFKTQNDGVLYLGCNCLGYKGQAPTGKLQIKEGTIIIGDNAFFGCKGLTSITIPNTLTRIGGHAFYRCSGLKIIAISKSISEIGSCAFSDCNSLTSIVVDGGNEKYDSRGNCNAIIETKTNILVVGCKNTNIPNSVTEIGAYAFNGCNGLMSITIPDAVSKIGNGAFSSCSSLTSINIPKSIAEIGKQVFDNCYNLISIFVDKDNVKYDSRDNSNAIIETSSNILIYGCKNTNIPNSVTEIGSYAFYGCNGLTSITIPNAVSKIGDGAFISCIGLISIIIPESVIDIGNGAFNGCKRLTSMTIPNSVSKIGIWTFGGCKDLTSINISNSVAEIGSIAFIGCRSLTSIKLPSSVITIGRNAFKCCDNLEEIIIPQGSRLKFEKMLEKELHSKLVEM